MKAKINMKIDSRAHALIVLVNGEISAVTDEEIGKMYRSLNFETQRVLIMDFSEVGYINSAGVATLIGIITDMSANKRKTIFSGLSPHYKRVIDIVGIGEYADVFDTLEQAIELISE